MAIPQPSGSQNRAAVGGETSMSIGTLATQSSREDPHVMQDAKFLQLLLFFDAGVTKGPGVQACVLYFFSCLSLYNEQLLVPLSSGRISSTSQQALGI